ncbi:TetR/AcrR family transcriptional regulator [Myxococcus sp. K15C18031901]|uniref:TetR/AcrR family transcriptional regulator n=1 Tax=Myxococcus dinghuensis TaxID=2906761 RepID=UPI0020A740E2|nr:TetR/AcrR family transcriptional regulator [Myxococcus dinghuensis]MCP3103390.1 TetR/AcrR family transcriptional regulator [Myxococcus dinghuensis]
MFKSMNVAQVRIHDAALRLFAEKGVTQLTVKELADAAGVARGTVYNHFESVDSLFQQVATRLADEMHERVTASFEQTADPAQRLANGIRFFVRRAHEEPHWGRFLVRFAVSTPTLQGLWSGPPASDMALGMERGRFSLRPEQFPSAIALLGGGVLAAMALVLEGHRTWRDAGAETAELYLRALGVPPDEALRLSTTELPALPPPGGLA